MLAEAGAHRGSACEALGLTRRDNYLDKHRETNNLDYILRSDRGY